MSDTITINGRVFPVVSHERKDARLVVMAEETAKKSKYGNHKVVVDGEKFDSEREYKRHLVLLDMQAKGEIRELKRQVTFDLVVNDEKIGSVRPDWTYQRRTCLNGMAWVFSDPPAYGSKVAEDSKGYQTKDHKTRWKLAQALYPEIEWKLS